MFPVLDAGLTNYLAKCDKFPIPRSLIAMRYRGYGLPIADIISEGNVGLMQAVKRFEPERGFRLATYAMWWIKASIQEYILRSWSLVKMGTNAAQKKLFFKLRRTKAEISALEDGDLRPEHVAMIAKRLGVQENDVVEMNRRLGGDASLNTEVHADEAGEVQDWLVDPAPSPEAMYADQEEAKQRRRALAGALELLNTRERCIFEARFLSERRSGLRSSRHDTAFRASGCGRSKFAHLKSRLRWRLDNRVAVQRNKTGNPLLALHREERRVTLTLQKYETARRKLRADCDQRK